MKHNWVVSCSLIIVLFFSFMAIGCDSLWDIESNDIISVPVHIPNIDTFSIASNIAESDNEGLNIEEVMLTKVSLYNANTNVLIEQKEVSFDDEGDTVVFEKIATGLNIYATIEIYVEDLKIQISEIGADEVLYEDAIFFGARSDTKTLVDGNNELKTRPNVVFTSQFENDYYENSGLIPEEPVSVEQAIAILLSEEDKALPGATIYDLGGYLEHDYEEELKELGIALKPYIPVFTVNEEEQVVFTPAGGQVSEGATFKLTHSNPNVQIYYWNLETSDNRILYTKDSEIVINFGDKSEVTYVADAEINGELVSPLAFVTYTKANVTPVVVEPPVFLPNGGTVAEGTTFTLSSETYGADIFYTTDTSIYPIGNWIKYEPYTAEVAFNGAQSVTYRAVALLNSAVSEVTTMTYTKPRDIAPVEPSTNNNAYQIGEAGHLVWFRDQVDSGNTTYNAELTADIDISGYLWDPIGEASESSGYAGIFDGKGFTISGLTINNSANDQGLFSYIHGGTVQNLMIKDANLSINRYSGILAGVTQGGAVFTNIAVINSTIDSVYYNAYNGGIIGYHGNHSDEATLTSSFTVNTSLGIGTKGSGSSSTESYYVSTTSEGAVGERLDSVSELNTKLDAMNELTSFSGYMWVQNEIVGEPPTLKAR